MLERGHGASEEGAEGLLPLLEPGAEAVHFGKEGGGGWRAGRGVEETAEQAFELVAAELECCVRLGESRCVADGGHGKLP